MGNEASATPLAAGTGEPGAEVRGDARRALFYVFFFVILLLIAAFGLIAEA